MTTSTTTRTILNDSGVRADVAHYWCCCKTPNRGRYFVRTQVVTRAVLEAVDTYGCSADTPELDALVRSVRHWTRRFRKAVKLHTQGRITDDQYRAIDRRAELACQALGTYVTDAFYGAAALRCPIHPENVHEAACSAEARPGIAKTATDEGQGASDLRASG